MVRYKDAIDDLDVIEDKLNSDIDNIYSSLTKEVNECLNKILSSATYTAKSLQTSIKDELVRLRNTIQQGDNEKSTSPVKEPKAKKFSVKLESTSPLKEPKPKKFSIKLEPKKEKTKHEVGSLDELDRLTKALGTESKPSSSSDYSSTENEVDFDLDIDELKRFNSALNKNKTEKFIDSIEEMMLEEEGKDLGKQFETGEEETGDEQFNSEEDHLASILYDGYIQQTNDINAICEDIQGISKDIKEKKDYKCDQCSFLGKTETSFKKHIRDMHTKIKNLKCEKCDYVTAQKGNLSKHVKMKHNESNEVHHCRYCEYTSVIKCNITRHEKSKHNVGPEETSILDNLLSENYEPGILNTILNEHFENEQLE